MIDTHCHLAFDVFEGRVDQVIAEAGRAGVRGLITVSTTTTNMADNLAIARAHPEVWCSAGVHPLYADQPINWEQLRHAGTDPRVVAWGELGLDNHYEQPAHDIQLKTLEEQLAVLQSLSDDGLDKPIIVHCRKSFDDLLPVFRQAGFDPWRYVFHCFTGTLEDAKAVLDFGAWISFTGVVTYKNAPEVAEAAAMVPPDRIMVETDAPFLSPVPHRKVWPCEPRFVVDTARFIAERRGVDPIEFERQLDSNAERFFGITLDAGNQATDSKPDEQDSSG